MSGCAFEADDVGSVGGAQTPIEGIEAGVYAWTLVTSNQTVTGHVVVRGPDADPIGQYGYAANSETWYVGGSSSGGNAIFQIELLMMDDPSDKDLLDLIDEIRTNEDEIGTTDMIPEWKEDPTIGQGVQVYTLTSVTGGPGQYGSLYEHVSFAMPSTSALPTFYSDNANLYSIFGGSSQSVPIQEGITATFSAIGSNDDGYPDSSWYYY